MQARFVQFHQVLLKAMDGSIALRRTGIFRCIGRDLKRGGEAGGCDSNSNWARGGDSNSTSAYSCALFWVLLLALLGDLNRISS